MQRQSEQALDLLTTSDEIISSIETHGVEVAAKLEEKWQAMPALTSTPQVEEPERPNVLGHLFALRDGLAGSAAFLSGADRTHVHQLGELIRVRGERNELADSVFDTFSIMRRTIEELQGPGTAFVLAGIEGPTAQQTNKLVRQVDLAVPRLADLELPQAKVAGIEVDPKAMGHQLQEQADRLRQKQGELRRMRRIVQASRKEKNRALEEHREVQVWTARIVEGYYRLAGETELADRLRPATVRAGRPRGPATPGDSPEEPAPVDGTPVDGTAGEPAAEENTGEEPTLDASASD